MMPLKPSDDLGEEYVFQKLGKSLIALTDIKKGEKLSLENLSGQIFNSNHIPVRESGDLIGKVAKVNIAKGSPIKRDALEV
jgi:sialic acid synthase